jgi:hypothetical protein
MLWVFVTKLRDAIAYHQSNWKLTTASVGCARGFLCPLKGCEELHFEILYNYSYFNARNGSIFIARRAGI